MCIIDERDDWFGDCTHHEKVIWFKDIKGLTLRQVICKYFNTTSGDIKNSPGLYGICGVPITDMNKIIDDSFINLHITKRWKKSSNDEFFIPSERVIFPKLTLEEYTFCSDYRLIAPFKPKFYD